ncbi:hypothetical protein ACGFIV_34640 [Sphaerisporangium sp. NPDC049003]|uniref:hypothetical protein n=1 Tax=Sphaerisporangium sp. NPDC049003 TaxID=3364517 RepID=UPI00371CF8C5
MNQPHALVPLPRRVLLLGVTASLLTVPAAGLGASPASAQRSPHGTAAPASPPIACLPGNGGFEEPAGVDGAGTLKKDVPSWHTDSADGLIKIWGRGNASATGAEIPADSGTQFAELNGTQASTLHQDVATRPRTLLVWRLAHRARSASPEQKDVIHVRIGAPGSTGVQVPLGQTTGDIADGGMAWGHYMGIYRVPKRQKVTRISIESVSAASGSPIAGNFLDSVEVGCTGACPKAKFRHRSCDSLGLPLSPQPHIPPAPPSHAGAVTEPIVLPLAQPATR